MKQVVLIFPSTGSIADFISLNQVKGVLVDSVAQTLSAVLSDEEIAIACTHYGAELGSTKAAATPG